VATQLRGQQVINPRTTRLPVLQHGQDLKTDRAPAQHRRLHPTAEITDRQIRAHRQLDVTGGEQMLRYRHRRRHQRDIGQTGPPSHLPQPRTAARTPTRRHHQPHILHRPTGNTGRLAHHPPQRRSNQIRR
jgi:hypothetical protein